MSADPTNRRIWRTTWAVRALECALLCAVCKLENADSAQLMTRLGMTYRRLERRYDTDMAVYQLTRDDWLAAAG